jgi:hypothetical protein
MLAWHLNAITPLLAARANDLWYALPLIVAISLVYSATRHERSGAILSGAARFGGWICAFMGLAFAILYYMSSRL